MTTPIESVVTPERFQQGLTWNEWMKQIDRNQEEFRENYESTIVNLEDVAAIKQLIAFPRGPNVWGVGRHAPGKVLALAEAWCADCYRGVPVMARLCEGTGLELRIFFRDQNLDIMNEFLYKGEFQSIPTFVFYTRVHEYLGRWIEMPQQAREEHALLEEITSKMHNPDLTPAEHERCLEDYAAFQRGPVWNSWRQAQVKETRRLLEVALERARMIDEMIDATMND